MKNCIKIIYLNCVVLVKMSHTDAAGEMNIETHKETDKEKYQEKPYLLLYDLETDGKDVVVQIAYYKCLLETLAVIETKNYFLNDGSNTPDYFNILVDKIITEGRHPDTIIHEIHSDFIGATYIAGFNNKGFDNVKIGNYFRRYNLELSFNNTLDAMLLMTDIVQAKNKYGYTKWPKLVEAYDYICKKDNKYAIDNFIQHDALYDVQATYNILLFMVENKIIQL